LLKLRIGFRPETLRAQWLCVAVVAMGAIASAGWVAAAAEPTGAPAASAGAPAAPIARSWEAPAGFEDQPVPADNPPTAEKVALGQALFFDQRLSGDGSRSCYSCHVCEKGLTDGLPLAVGAFGKKLPRSSPTLWNIGYHTEFYWDGRSPSLEAQALAAWKGANMGANPDSIAAALNQIAGYRQQFQKAFGQDATPVNITKALAAFERTILCGNTAFDRWQQGEENAVSESVKKGWELFRGKAACGTCHAGALFTDLTYHNVGIGLAAPNPDLGRTKITKEAKHTGAFKTPTLRDISRSAPYFHDGSAATLEEAVKIMVGGGKANPNLDVQLKPVTLTEAEMASLLDFLASLDCPCDLAAPALPK
jgi:cytochrome c peroxidase